MAAFDVIAAPSGAGGRAKDNQLDAPQLAK